MLHKSTVRCEVRHQRAINPARPVSRPPFPSTASLRARTTTKANSRGRTSSMSALAVIAPNSVQSDAVSVRERRISKRMQKVLSLLATKGITQREAAKQGGMTEAYLSTALRKPQIQMFVARKMRETIAIGGLRASARLVDLIDAGSEHVSADVSKHVLAIAGIKPTADAQVSVNIDIKAGYVIDLTDDVKRPPTIDVPHD